MQSPTRFPLFFAAATTLACLLIADAPAAPPATQPAAPRHTYRSARGHYDAAITAARREYVTNLREAIRGAMTRNDLDEAKRIEAVIKSVEAELKRPTRPTPNETTAPSEAKFDVRSDREWEPALRVRKGDVVQISAQGTWCLNTADREHLTLGPDGRRPDGTADDSPASPCCSRGSAPPYTTSATPWNWRSSRTACSSSGSTT